MVKVVISNGFGKFHLAVAASGMARAGALESFITGAYPVASIRGALRIWPLAKNRKLKRLLQRGEEIPDEKVHPLWIAELVYAAGFLARRWRAVNRLGELMIRYSMRLYGRLAVQHVRKAAQDGAKIYHYRAGLGHKSVAAAKDLGMFALCDHSAVHPSLFRYLGENEGRMPDIPIDPPNGIWADILSDIEQADAVLVNSDFVRKTFTAQGWSRSPLHVIYLGVDDQFADAIPGRQGQTAAATTAPLRILFAGGFISSKGANACIAALTELEGTDWRFEIAGSVAPEIERAHPSFFDDPRVSRLGWLPRADLARRMSECDVFLFPSLTEGSARVVFEALACGCYVITTPNSGSIVEDDVHGALAPVGDAQAIKAALRAANADRARLGSIGAKNANQIASNYTQEVYMERLATLYLSLPHGPSSKGGDKP